MKTILIALAFLFSGCAHQTGFKFDFVKLDWSTASGEFALGDNWKKIKPRKDK